MKKRGGFQIFLKAAPQKHRDTKKTGKIPRLFAYHDSLFFNMSKSVIWSVPVSFSIYCRSPKLSTVL